MQYTNVIQWKCAPDPNETGDDISMNSNQLPGLKAGNELENETGKSRARG